MLNKQLNMNMNIWFTPQVTLQKFRIQAASANRMPRPFSKEGTPFFFF